MSKKLYACPDGTLHKVSPFHVTINDVIHKIKKGYVVINGYHRQFYASSKLATGINSVTVETDRINIIAILNSDICVYKDSDDDTNIGHVNFLTGEVTLLKKLFSKNPTTSSGTIYYLEKRYQVNDNTILYYSVSRNSKGNKYSHGFYIAQYDEASDSITTTNVTTNIENIANSYVGSSSFDYMSAYDFAYIGNNRILFRFGKRNQSTITYQALLTLDGTSFTDNGAITFNSTSDKYFTTVQNCVSNNDNTKHILLGRTLYGTASSNFQLRFYVNECINADTLSTIYTSYLEQNSSLYDYYVYGAGWLDETHIATIWKRNYTTVYNFALIDITSGSETTTSSCYTMDSINALYDLGDGNVVVITAGSIGLLRLNDSGEIEIPDTLKIEDSSIPSVSSGACAVARYGEQFIIFSGTNWIYITLKY